MGRWRLCTLPVAPETFETALYGLQAAGFRGVNVTIPHKESAYKIATIREKPPNR